jgi:hypothetical protein
MGLRTEERRKDLMNTKRWMVVASVLAALAVAAAMGTQAVYADTTTPPGPPDGRGMPPDGAPRLHRLGPAGLEAAAGVLGMTTDELSSEFEAGKTLEDVATEKGVDLEDVQQAIQAAHKQEMLERISQAVSDGKMIQEKADWLIVGLQNGYLDGPGFGFGPGMHFGRPPGGRGPLPGATQQP